MAGSFKDFLQMLESTDPETETRIWHSLGRSAIEWMKNNPQLVAELEPHVEMNDDEKVLDLLRKNVPDEHLRWAIMDQLFPGWTQEMFGESELVVEQTDDKHPLGKAFRTPKGPKRFAIYVEGLEGKVLKVNFGGSNSPKSQDKTSRWKGRYWSCKMW